LWTINFVSGLQGDVLDIDPEQSHEVGAPSMMRGQPRSQRNFVNDVVRYDVEKVLSINRVS
jgi:hypothetical protein